MQSPPSLYIPQFQLRELFVCFGRLNRILAEIGHGDFSVHSIMDKPMDVLIAKQDTQYTHILLGSEQFNFYCETTPPELTKKG